MRPPDTTGGEAFKLFTDAPDLSGIAIVGKGELGLLSRATFFAKYSGQFGQAVFERRPIRPIVNWNPLVVNAMMPLDELLRHTQDQSQTTSEGFLVVHNDTLIAVADNASLNRAAAKAATAQAKRLQELTEALELSRQEAQAANQAKSEFLANMNHELRTPLNVILGYAELIEEELHEGQETIRRDIERITLAGRHLLGVVTGILDLSKIESGKLEFENHTFSVSDWLAVTASLVEPLAVKNRNRLVVDAPRDLGSAYADEVRLRQCLLNIASNACKFTSDGCVSIRVRTENDLLAITVSDTGIGISEEQLARLFQPFVQADSSINPRSAAPASAYTSPRRSWRRWAVQSKPRAPQSEERPSKSLFRAARPSGQKPQRSFASATATLQLRGRNSERQASKITHIASALAHLVMSP